MKLANTPHLTSPHLIICERENVDQKQNIGQNKWHKLDSFFFFFSLNIPTSLVLLQEADDNMFIMMLFFIPWGLHVVE